MPPPDWPNTFLYSLTQSPNVSKACDEAGVSRKTAYLRRKEDRGFAEAWDDALEQSTDSLVGECYRRAKEGTEKPVFHRGAVCGHVREYSDTLAIFLLKAHRPAVYREKTEQRHSGEVKVIVEYADADTPETPPRSA